MGRFRMGEHEFLMPGEPASIERMFVKDRQPLRGAVAPAWLRGVATDFDPSGPAQNIVDGSFCGHGEPTYGVFDIAIDGQRELELAIVEQDESRRVLVRRPGSGGVWTVLHDSAWFADQGGAPAHPQGRTDVSIPDATPFTDEDEQPARFRIAVGYEYPVECQSESDVSWVTFAAENARDGQSGIFHDEELA